MRLVITLPRRTTLATFWPAIIPPPAAATPSTTSSRTATRTFGATLFVGGCVRLAGTTFFVRLIKHLHLLVGMRVRKTAASRARLVAQVGRRTDFIHRLVNDFSRLLSRRTKNLVP